MGAEALNISGSGFGSKSPAAPLCWSTFESGTIGASVAGTSPTIGSKTWASDHATIPPVYDGTHAANGSKAAKFRWVDGTNTQADITYNIAEQNSKKFYIYYKRYMVPSDEPIASSNVKNFYFTTSSTAYGEGSGISLVPGGGNQWAWYNNSGRVGSTLYSTPTLAFSDTNNKWQTWEFFTSMNNLPATNDGVVKMWVDGVSYLDRSDYYATNADQIYSYLSLGNMYQQNESPDTTPNSTASAWYDDVYIDVTQARILACTGPTWETRGSCEIQAPTAWSNTAITAALNQGSFTNGSTVYAYVVDASGNVSNGHPVTFATARTAPPRRSAAARRW